MARRLRPGQPLTEREHTLLYLRATEGSSKDAAAALGMNRNTARNHTANIFKKLDVEDLAGAFRAMGWLNPVPYGVSPAEVRAERLREGEDIERAFWQRMKR